MTKSNWWSFVFSVCITSLHCYDGDCCWSLLPRKGQICWFLMFHDDVMKWKHLPRYWTFVRGIHRSPVNSPHKGHWRGTLICSSICDCPNRWANNGEAGELRRHDAHCDVISMQCRVMASLLVVQGTRASIGRFDIKSHNGATSLGISSSVVIWWVIA